MKRSILFAAVILMCFLLTACGNGNKKIDETKFVETEELTVCETTESSLPDGIDPGDYHKLVCFQLPADFRQAVVDYMYKQASVQWTCAESFGVKEEWEHWGINLDFRKNVKYTGLPYASSQVTVELFNRVLDNGKYTSESTSWKEVHGVQCVSSILNALQQVMIVDGWSYSLNPGSEDFDGKILGDYKVDVKPINSETHTSVVCENNGMDTMYEAYALAQKGDVIMKSDNTVHARMVVDATVIRNGDGVINPNRSMLTCIEQTNSFDHTRTDHVKTTWFVDHKYTFYELFKNGYLPSTFEAYQTGQSETPYITLDTEITSSVLAKEVLTGNIRSNYPLRYIVLEILGGNGERVKEYTARGGMKDYAFGLRKYSYVLFGDGLDSGEYTFVLTAGIAIGEAELARVEFTAS